MTITAGNGAGTNGTYSSNEGGGAIFNEGPLTLTNCTVNQSTSLKNGGGIYNSSTLTLNSCTVSNNNTAPSNYAGGGIYNYFGFMTIEKSTISHNSVTGSGGGISNLEAESELKNVTISNNSSSYGGGIRLYKSNLTLNNVTIHANTANNNAPAIDMDNYAVGTVNIGNSII